MSEIIQHVHHFLKIIPGTDSAVQKNGKDLAAWLFLKASGFFFLKVPDAPYENVFLLAS